MVSRRGQWNPTLSQKARKDGAPVTRHPSAVSSQHSALSGRELWNPTPFDCAQGRLFAKCAKGWGTRQPSAVKHSALSGRELWNPTPSTALRAGPFAKCAKGWAPVGSLGGQSG